MAGKKYPDILSDTHNGPCRYGSRQNFDLTHPGYRFHAERIIRKLMEQVQNYSCVIGFQLDNETKPYDTCSPRAQELFKKWLKERFATVNDLNEETFKNYLMTKNLPDVDLLIRTSNELRLSNFLLYEVAYSEFVFIDRYWPDFNSKDLDYCIEQYNKRNRRFGDAK